MPRKIIIMLGVAITDFTRNNCPYAAAGVAYWTLFSLFPLALAGISVLGFLYPTPDAQDSIVEGIIEIVPVSQSYLAGLVQTVTESRGTLGTLAALGLLWTGTAVFSAIRKGINHAWHIGRPHYFLLERAIDLVMLLGVALLVFVHVLLVTDLFGVATLASDASRAGYSVVIKVFFELVALSVTFGAFILLYKYVPNRSVVWGDIWHEAIVGAVLFQGVRLGFTWFISNFNSFNLVYGSLGALMAVLVWAYLSTMAIMLGAQLAYTYSGVFGSRAGEISLPKRKRRIGFRRRRRSVRGMLTTVLSWLLPSEEDRRQSE